MPPQFLPIPYPFFTFASPDHGSMGVEVSLGLYYGEREAFDMARTTKRTRYARELAPGMLTVRDVARLLHVHVNTVRRWSDLGLLRTYRIGSRRDRRFAPQDISEFLETNKRRLAWEELDLTADAMNVAPESETEEKVGSVGIEPTTNRL